MPRPPKGTIEAEIDAHIGGLITSALRFEYYYPKPSDIMDNPPRGSDGRIVDRATLDQLVLEAREKWNAEFQHRERNLYEQRSEIRKLIHKAIHEKKESEVDVD